MAGRGQAVKPEMLALISRRVKAEIRKGRGMMAAYAAVGAEVGMSAEQVGKLFRMLMPTANLATDLFRARAFRMASRVIKEARAPELIDILSRPNIGVLEPIKKVESGGGGGFFLSVDAGSCGAVSVRAGMVSEGAQAQAPQLTEGGEVECNALQSDFQLSPAEAEQAEEEAIEAQVLASEPADEEDEEPQAPNVLPPAPEVHGMPITDGIKRPGRPKGAAVGPGHSQKFEQHLAELRERLAKRQKHTEKERARRGRRAAEAQEALESVGGDGDEA